MKTKMYTILDLEDMKLYKRSLKSLIAMINEDHSDEFLNYDESDWLEGWLEWCEGFPYVMITDRSIEQICYAIYNADNDGNVSLVIDYVNRYKPLGVKFQYCPFCETYMPSYLEECLICGSHIDPSIPL
jgi:hypothetical protein